MVDKMNQELNETLSALMDDELSAADSQRSFSELADNANARQAWQRYHLIRDSVTQNLPQEIDLSFVERVSNAISKEPAHHLASPRAARAGYFNWLRLQPAYGVAAAALIVAVVTVLQIDRGGEQPPMLAERAGATTPAANPPLVAATESAAVEDSERQLSAYMANHMTRSRSYVLHDGLLPYVHAVDYQNNR